MAIRRTLSLTAALGLLCLAVVAGCHDHSSPEYTVLNEAVPSDQLAYAGSNVCRTCHEAIFESWEKTRHTKKVRVASLATVVNDADNNGVNDFVQGGGGLSFDVAGSVPPIQTTFDDYTLSPGVEFPKLGWDGTNLLLRIGPNTYPVTFVLGGTGKWKQRYMVTIGNGEYISPVQYNEVTREYVPYDPGYWYTMAGTTLTGYIYNSGTQTPVTQGNTRDSWQRRCAGCHTTGLQDISVNASGEFGDNITDMLANHELSELPIACESCHGPSKRHVELGGGVGTALNPEDLASDRADEVCGSCHTRGTSANAQGFGYPWGPGALTDNQFQPGDVLADFYVNNGGLWDDGAMTSKQHHQQWLDHRNSPHAKAGVTCFKCHDPHGSGIDADLRMEPQELCLSCHDGRDNIDSADLSLHTRHSAAEAQSCENCHFTLTAKSAINYDIASHTYRIIYPVETETSSGIPNTCARCHKDESVSELTGYLRARFPNVKPVAYASTDASPFGVGFTLDGGRSFDPLGGPLTYEWTFKSGPPSFTADQLLAGTAQEALFVPSQPGKHTFLLVVTNSSGIRSHPAEVVVDVTAGVGQSLPDLSQANYVRSFTCAFCHEDTHADWEVTRHPQKVRRPNEGAGMVFADTDENGQNDWTQNGMAGFNLASDPLAGRTAWDDVNITAPFAPNAPVLLYNSATDAYSVQIGPNTYRVTFVVGGTGKWKQRYMTTIDNGEYILPIQFNEATNEWVTYDPEHWYVIDGTTGDYTDFVYGAGDTPVDLGLTANSWQRRCTACHVTGARDLTVNADGEFGDDIEDMLTNSSGPRIASLGVGCEACHGPGSIHEAAPTLRGSIVNPAKLSALRSNETCGACHNRGKSVNALGFGFPWGASTVGGHYMPGMDLSDYYVPNDEAGSSFWNDPYGHSKQHHQQWLDLRWSKHFTEGGMTCGTCHTGHNDNFAGQLTQEETSLCTSCHRDIVTGQGRERNHSRHPDKITKCSNCHNPLVAKSAIPYDVSAHSFQVIWPEATLETGIPNSCNTRGCHSNPINGLRAWDYDPDIAGDAAGDYAEQQARLNNLFGDMRPYAEPRILGTDGKARRVVTGMTAPVTITLDGMKSYDPNGARIASYAWTILSAPESSSAKLSSRLLARPKISITVPGTYTFSLVVSDLAQTSEPETVTIEVN